MTTTPSTPPSGSGGPARVGTAQTGAPQEIDQLHEDIAQARENLAETAEALAAKADVKARTKDKVTEVTAKAGEQAGHAAHTAKVKATQAGHQVHETVTDLTVKAKETATSPQAATWARRAGAAAASAGLVLAWVWRRRARRDPNPWHRAVRQAKTRVKAVRGQAKIAKAKAKTLR